MLTLLLTVAHAAPELPVPAAARPATLPRASVRIEADTTIGAGPGPAEADLAAGFAVGVTDAFELGAQVLPFDLAPRIRYTAPSLHARAAADLGETAAFVPSVRLFVPVIEGDQPAIDATAGLRLRAADALQLDLGGAAHLGFGEAVTTALALPASAVLQLDRRLFLAADTAVATDPTDARFRIPRPSTGPDDLYVPLGASLGATFGRVDTALTDVSIGVHFPGLASVERGRTVLHTEDFLVMAAVRSVVPTAPGRARPSAGRRRPGPR